MIGNSLMLSLSFPTLYAVHDGFPITRRAIAGMFQIDLYSQTQPNELV